MIISKIPITFVAILLIFLTSCTLGAFTQQQSSPVYYFHIFDGQYRVDKNKQTPENNNYENEEDTILTLKDTDFQGTGDFRIYKGINTFQHIKTVAINEYGYVEVSLPNGVYTIRRSDEYTTYIFDYIVVIGKYLTI